MSNNENGTNQPGGTGTGAGNNLTLTATEEIAAITMARQQLAAQQNAAVAAATTAAVAATTTTPYWIPQHIRSGTPPSGCQHPLAR